MKVLVVVVNYKTPELALRCLESLNLEVANVGSMRVVVVDNDSGDASVDVIGGAIESEGWGWCTLIAHTSNAGFGAGNNVGMRAHLDSDDAPEYVMFLNPDAYLRDGAVRALLDFMESHPKVGIAGARVQDVDGAQSQSAFRFPSVATELVEGFKLGVLTKALNDRQLLLELGDEPMRVDWVTGAAVMIRKEVLDEVGPFDEEFFLYFEEVDLCYRALQAGWEAYYVPDSVVVHLQAQASGITDDREVKRRFPRYWFESRRRFFVKNRGKTHALLADLAFLGGYTTFRARSVIQQRPDEEPPHFWWDFLRNSVLVKGFKL